MLQDLRFTFRLLATERWFSTLGVIVLALGIGVNAIGFTIVNAAFLRGLPFKEADRLFVVSWQGRSGRQAISYAEVQDWRSQTRAFTTLAAFRNDAMNLSDDRALPEQVRGTRITANAFGILDQQPCLAATLRRAPIAPARIRSSSSVTGSGGTATAGIPMSSGPRCA